MATLPQGFILEKQSPQGLPQGFVIEQAQPVQQPVQQAQPVQPNNMMDVGLREQFMQNADPIRGEAMFGMFPDVGVSPAQRQEALNQVELQQAAAMSGIPVEEFARSAAGTGLDIAGGIGGTITGAKLGARLGPVGALAGGALGSILGAAGGKVAGGELGVAPETTATEALLGSTKEEALARIVGAGLGGAARLVTPLIKPVLDNFPKLQQKFRAALDGTSIEDSFISSTTIDPTDLTGRNIIDAQENVLGRRYLTTFEETAGAAGQRQQAELGKVLPDVIRESQQESAFFKNREAINRRVKSAIANKTPNIADNAFADNIKKSITASIDTFQKPIRETVAELRDIRPRVSFPIAGVRDSMDALRSAAETELGAKQANKLFSVINKVIPTGKEALTFAEAKRLNEDIKDALPNFLPSKDAQSKLAGWYSGNIQPIIQGAKTAAVEAAPEVSALRRAAMLEGRLAGLKESEGAILNSQLVRDVGGREFRQELKLKPADKVFSSIYKSPDTWGQTKAILEQSNPDLIPVLETKFRADILKDSFDPKLNEVTFDKLSATLKKRGEDTIRAIGGDKYLEVLKDSQQITKALNTTKGLKLLNAPLRPSEDLTGQAIKAATLPLARKKALFTIMTTSARKMVGLGKVSDERLFKMMQGETGQKIVEDALNTPFDSPQAYNVYTSMVREFNKLGADVEQDDEPTFRAKVDNMLSLVFNNKE